METRLTMEMLRNRTPHVVCFTPNMSFVKWHNKAVFIQASKFNSEVIVEIKGDRIFFNDPKVGILSTVSLFFLLQYEGKLQLQLERGKDPSLVKFVLCRFCDYIKQILQIRMKVLNWMSSWF